VRAVARADIGEALIRGAVFTLEPFVRRMIAHGVTFGRLERRLHDLFVRVAEREFADAGGPPTDTRVAMVTGLNRREVHRIRSEDAGGRAPSTFTRSVTASLISRWVSDPATTRGGRPIPLRFSAARGPSFEKLARKTTLELRPRALLDTLIRTGAVTLLEGERISLTRRAYTPARGQPEMLAILAQDPPELVDTTLHNVLGEGPATRLQHKVAYDNIGGDALERLRETLNREAEKLLSRADRTLAKLDRDRNPKAPGGERTYAGIGIYSFEAPYEPPEPPPEATRRPSPKTSKKRTGKKSP